MIFSRYGDFKVVVPGTIFCCRLEHGAVSGLLLVEPATSIVGSVISSPSLLDGQTAYKSFLAAFFLGYKTSNISISYSIRLCVSTPVLLDVVSPPVT